jgi:hypothetical protein
MHTSHCHREGYDKEGQAHHDVLPSEVALLDGSNTQAVAGRPWEYLAGTGAG